jgi:hypothetical protein
MYPPIVAPHRPIGVGEAGKDAGQHRCRRRPPPSAAVLRLSPRTRNMLGHPDEDRATQDPDPTEDCIPHQELPQPQENSDHQAHFQYSVAEDERPRRRASTARRRAVRTPGWMPPHGAIHLA